MTANQHIQTNNQKAHLITPNLDSVDPGLLSALLAAIREHPVGQKLTEEDQLAIASLAIDQGTFGNASWLNQKSQEFLKARLAGQPLTAKKDAKTGELASEPINSFHEVKIPKKVNIQNKDDLLHVLAQHSLWQESVLDPNKQIVGGRADLSGQDLSNYDLSGLDLRGANLEGALFKETNLDKTKLATANLKSCKFLNSSLIGASLRRAKLSYASFISCKIEKADFSFADISHCKWDDTDKDVARFAAIKDQQKSPK